MNGPARIGACVVILLVSALPAMAQVNYQPTPPPVVTANGEQWYREGQPIMADGIIYYPAGSQIHFNANEMVRSGFFKGIPLYTRTTIEPHSVVFVPLDGGLMQPYERRRIGEVAGTVGSTTPSFPVQAASERPVAPATIESVLPAGTSSVTPAADVRAGEPRAVGTTGITATISVATIPPLRRLEGANALFVDFRGGRWFSNGGAVRLDTRRMTKVGEHAGFSVYTDPRDPASIYIPVTRDATELVARYSRRPPR
jgi:hypothetical protein